VIMATVCERVPPMEGGGLEDEQFRLVPSAATDFLSWFRLDALGDRRMSSFMV